MEISKLIITPEALIEQIDAYVEQLKNEKKKVEILELQISLGASSFIPLIESIFRELLESERIKIVLNYDKMTDKEFKKKIDDLLIMYGLKRKPKIAIWDKIKTMLKKSMLSEDFQYLLQKQELSEEESERLEYYMKLLRNAYAFLKYLASK